MSSDKTEINTSSLCRIKDTVQMLNIAVARIERAMLNYEESLQQAEGLNSDDDIELY